MRFVQMISEALYRWRHKIATGGVTVFAMYLAFHVVFGANGWMVYERKKAEHQRLQLEVQQMRVENDRLQDGIRNLQTADPNTIEKEAREQLKYARPGEVVYVMPTLKKDIPAAAENKVPAK